jgi:elongation factor Ts
MPTSLVRSVCSSSSRVAAGEPLAALAKEMMHHIASADPQPIGVVETDVPTELVDRERRIAEEQVAQEGKPENIRAKIVEGQSAEVRQ